MRIHLPSCSAMIGSESDSRFWQTKFVIVPTMIGFKWMAELFEDAPDAAAWEPDRRMAPIA